CTDDGYPNYAMDYW
nr:immunoglobulin heavy chain junction region [Mus musculus]MBK4183708.1 immunoglobulin heavy chain junction region [Mus musculus]